MRKTAYVFAASLAVGLSGTASAQSPAAGQTTTAPSLAGETRSHWTAAAFVGTSIGSQTRHQSASVDFGGQIGYLWRGLVGGEFIGDDGPSFKLTNRNLRFTDDPDVRTFMVNAIAAVPLGSQGQFQPYISGGVGSVGLSATIFAIIPPAGVDPASIASTSVSRSSVGTNIGGGVLAYFGHVGLRGDVRFYKAETDNALNGLTDLDLISRTTLSGLEFWHANVGVAFRW